MQFKIRSEWSLPAPLLFRNYFAAGPMETAVRLQESLITPRVIGNARSLSSAEKKSTLDQSLHQWEAWLLGAHLLFPPSLSNSPRFALRWQLGETIVPLQQENGVEFRGSSSEEKVDPDKRRDSRPYLKTGFDAYSWLGAALAGWGAVRLCAQPRSASPIQSEAEGWWCWWRLRRRGFLRVRHRTTACIHATGLQTRSGIVLSVFELFIYFATCLNENNRTVRSIQKRGFSATSCILNGCASFV